LASAEDAERTHALQATLQGCDRAVRLVEQLLTLSRLEAGNAPASSCLDLGAVVREVVAGVATLALAKGQTIEVESTQPAWVQAEAILLSVLVRNLVDNAIRYSPPGASVAVAIQSAPGGVELTVDDGGPGLSATDIEHLGERFFRVIGSGQSGSGLGWSIVRRIAAVVGAEVVVSRSAWLGGLGVKVIFPSVPGGADQAPQRSRRIET
jgi:two-component system sensor histidine kinase QseC